MNAIPKPLIGQAVVNVSLSEFETSKTTLLTYYAERVKLKQARFKERLVLVPQIDLARYRLETLIDFVVFHVTLTAPSQFQYLQAFLAPLVTGSVAVHPLDATSSSSKNFAVTFQDPKGSEVRAALRALSGKWKLADDLHVAELEVSCDWYPKDEGEDQLVLLAGVLQKHFLPAKFDFSRHAALPRVAFTALDASGAKKTETLRLIEPKSRRGIYRSSYVDGTTYFGAREDSVFWRIMIKKTNERKSLTDFVALPYEEWRVRMEVNFKTVSLIRIGLRTLDDLLNFKFEKLRKDHFGFYLATVPCGQDNENDPFGRSYGNSLLEAFIKTGVVGVAHAEMRLFEFEQTKAKRHGTPMSKNLNSMKKMLSHRNGSRIAFEKINERIESSLRRLRF